MHGYSSSEESDDPRRPRAPPASNGNNNDQKKKKKPRQPPQNTINYIWKTFSKRKFSKALSVLPFDPVLPPAGPERANEPLNAGYERAVDECRRKVQKIIKECRRVNQRYRDPGFDLDWDLKWEKGHCLNYLGHTKWAINRSSLTNERATVPKAVKRVHEIFEQPHFMKTMNGDDVKQGSLGDCWLIASLTALANVPGGLDKICVEYDTRIGIYGFVFCRDGEWIYSIIDDKLYLKSPAWDSRSMQRDLLQQIDREDQEQIYRKTYQTGSKALFFGQCKDQNETWVPLIEKAYAKAHGDYASLIGGWVGEALEDLSGGVTTEMLVSDILDTDGFWDNDLSKVNEEFLFGCSTGLLECGYGDRDGISEGHAYVLMEARTLKSGKRLLKLRNPWGKTRKGLWEGAWSDGSKEWTPDVQEELDHHFGNDSSFWISYEDFLNKFQHIDRTRLFRDPNWRLNQRWIGVEVPWKPQYNEKFQFTLTKDSPLVITLAQLDERYFKGLQGQYTFRIHFRVHEKGQPYAQDYIVRSHGNYLMERAVSIEIPDMPAGEYSVYVSVAGERNTKLSSVEDVVKRECKGRSENEKLAQVGYAYDLAHSKGTAHLEEVTRLRQVKDQKKASESRQRERRKQWERRQMNRQVGRKQKVKNAEKRERKRAEMVSESEDEDEVKVEAAPQVEAQAEKVEEKAEEKFEEAKPEGKAEEKPEEKTEAKADDVKPAEPQTCDKSGTSGKNTPSASGDEKAAKPKRKSKKTKKPVRKRISESDGDSSDSPIEDWEALYSDDDMVRKPRLSAVQPSLSKSALFESEDEDAPDPWNAICIVGIRVYSKDENLELKTVIEGGDLSEGGMGTKGEAELDNAQDCAGGERERATETEAEVTEVEARPKKTKKAEEPETQDKTTASKTEEDKTKPEPVEEKTEKTADNPDDSNKQLDDNDTHEDFKSEKSVDSADYDKLDSGASTPGVLVTPMESGKQLG